jgi:5,10-methylenetetrahydrofolate reductase
MNEKVPGVRIPERLIHQMEKTKDPVQTAIQIASSTINQIKGICRGVHIMTLNWEDKVPAVLKAASF